MDTPHTKKKKWVVTLLRVAYQEAVVEIEALSETEIKRIATDMSGDFEYSTYDYELTSVDVHEQPQSLITEPEHL